MKKRLVVGFIAIIMCFNVTLYSFASISGLEEQQNQTQASMEEKQDELDNVQAQKNEALSKINELSTQIEESQKQLDTLNTQIKELEVAITKAGEEIKIAEEKYNAQQAALEKRVVAQYKSGKTTYLDVLLNSDSLTSFLSNYFLVGKIAKADKQLLESINAEKQSIEAQKQELESKKVDMKTKKAEAEKENVKLRNAKAQKNSQVAKLSEKEQSLQQQIEEDDRKMKELEEQIRNAQDQNGNNGTYNGIMQWPVPSSSKITSTFGMRIHPIYGIPKMHNGIDVGGAPWGAPFVAADDGVVIQASDKGNGYGQCVIIDHGGGVSTLYAHGSAIYVTVGQRVTRGQNVLAIGSSGVSTGKHAHFEVRVGGAPVNPIPYIT